MARLARYQSAALHGTAFLTICTDLLGISCMSAYPILTAAQMRWADTHTIEQLGIAGFELMDKAGRSVAEAVSARIQPQGRVLIVAGPGNNGGDGFAAARILIEHGNPVSLILLGSMEKLKGDAARHAEMAVTGKLEAIECPDAASLQAHKSLLDKADVVVDALFGTGLTRPLAGLVADAVDVVNGSERPVLSVDIASGIDSDTGQVLGAAVKADWTLPIAAYKWGHWLGEGREYAGEILLPARIGISDEVLERCLTEQKEKARSAQLIGKAAIDWIFRKRPRKVHKKDFGHVWVFGGSVGYTGAPQLAAMGAFAAGSGLVSIACPEDVYPIIAASSLEIMVHPQDQAPWQPADAVVAGPGWGKKQPGQLAALMSAKAPLVLDADALNMIAKSKKLAGALTRRSGVSVLTPHPGEAGRLLGRSAGEVQGDRLTSVLAMAGKYKSWVVLKGADSLIASPDNDVWLCPFGSPKLATAGTGDVLAGMIAGFLGQGLQPEDAIPAAVAAHALAGEQEDWHLAGGLADLIRRKLDNSDSFSNHLH